MIEATRIESLDHATAESLILGSHVLFANDKLAAIAIQNHLAAKFWCQRTRWCVADEQIFDDYRRTGPLILFRLLNENRKYLFSPSRLEFRNSRQRSLSLTAFIFRFPSIAAVIRSVTKNDWRARLSFGLCLSYEYFEHSLNLEDSKICALPHALRVRDDLVLRRNPIAQLPEGLRVGGILDIRDTAITHIPVSAHISGKVFR